MKKKPRRFPRSEALVVAIYARVSTEKQDNENQLAQLRKFAKAQKWQLAYEYVDVESGSKADRPQFKQMFADASRRKFDLLLFWSLDRLSREGVLPTLRYLETLTSYGVNWRSYTEQFFDSCGPFRDAVIAIMATLAKQERIRRSERTKAGLERARSQGKTLGRPPRRKFSDADIRWIREDRLKNGHTLRDVADKYGTTTWMVSRLCKRRRR
jgi:DNA invertase Pin-like site-specific DNA recombinase